MLFAMNPLPIPDSIATDISAQDRFWAKVEIGMPEDCWMWKGNRTTSKGHRYGVWRYQEYTFKPHRIAYRLKVGMIPDGLTIDHLCGEKMCCNPWHLQPVTQSENSKRATNGLCRCGLPRSGDLRRCKACHNAYHRNYRRKNAMKINTARRANYKKPRPLRSHDFS